MRGGDRACGRRLRRLLSVSERAADACRCERAGRQVRLARLPVKGRRRPGGQGDHLFRGEGAGCCNEATNRPSVQCVHRVSLRIPMDVCRRTGRTHAHVQSHSHPPPVMVASAEQGKIDPSKRNSQAPTFANKTTKRPHFGEQQMYEPSPGLRPRETWRIMLNSRREETRPPPPISHHSTSHGIFFGTVVIQKKLVRAMIGSVKPWP